MVILTDYDGSDPTEPSRIYCDEDFELRGLDCVELSYVPEIDRWVETFRFSSHETPDASYSPSEPHGHGEFRKGEFHVPMLADPVTF